MGQMRQDERRYEVVARYEEGGVSLRDLEAEYGINFRKIHRWVKEAEAVGGIAEWEKQRAQGELTAEQSKQLPKDVRRLQKELEEARLYNKLLNAMIDIAEEQMGIDIRKKPGAKRR